MKREFELPIQLMVRTEEKVPNAEKLQHNIGIFQDIIEELDYANKWDDGFDKKNTLNDWIIYICMYATDAAKMLKSEPSAGQRPREESRKLLIKAAGLCFSAIKSIDEGGPAPRHYDK